jgi:4'-phosphopantetheinyl transferase
VSVTVWEIDLRCDLSQIAALSALLSRDERNRAERFVRERDRHRFTVARGALRTILAGALGNDRPVSLAFDYGAYGKPSLAQPCNPHHLHFNLAHSHDLALLAVTQGQEVGIDVEYVRPEVEILALAQRFFSPAESLRLNGLAEDERIEAFFDCWARKESYIKARGEGLNLALARFEVGFGRGQPACLKVDHGDPKACMRWHLCHLDTRPGYRAALTLGGSMGALRRAEFNISGN